MDTISTQWSSVGDVVEATGVSSPTVRRAADRLGLVDHRTPGGHRRFEKSDVQRLLGHLGVTPRVEGYSPTEVRVLAVLSRKPAGVQSVRAVARASGLSPTAAGVALEALRRRGLVRSAVETVADGGSAREVTIHRLVPSPKWARIAAEVGRTVPPVADERAPAVPPTRVPRRFWHLFWNVDPARLDLEVDAEFVAVRMLSGHDPAAWAWAATNLPRRAVARARSARAIDARRRAMIDNVLSASA